MIKSCEGTESMFSQCWGRPERLEQGKLMVLIWISDETRDRFVFRMVSDKRRALSGVVMMVDLTPRFEKSLAISTVGIMWP